MAVEGAATYQAQVCGAADRINVWRLYELRDVAFDSSGTLRSVTFAAILPGVTPERTNDCSALVSRDDVILREPLGAESNPDLTKFRVPLLTQNGQDMAILS